MAFQQLCWPQTEISQRVEDKVDKDRRRFLLMEQLKYIKKELGIEKDDTSSVVERYGWQSCSAEPGAVLESNSGHSLFNFCVCSSPPTSQPETPLPHMATRNQPHMHIDNAHPLPPTDPTDPTDLL